MDPAVSVVMSVYNGAQYLNEAIDSMLGQTFKNFEFIIIDDGSTDRSNEIIKAYNDSRIVLIEQDNTGLAIALNNGIRLARTNYIARMDADDIALPQRLESQIAFLHENPDLVLIGTNALVIDKIGEFVFRSNLPTEWEVIKQQFPETSFYHSSVMFKKDAFYKAGGYFEETSKLYSFEDSILWNKMKKFGKMANLSEPLIKYRLIPNAATTKSGKEGKALYEILENIIQDNKLSFEDREKLLQIKNKLNYLEKERIYYVHLAKKYLVNNFIPQKVRYNARLALKLNSFKSYPYFLYILSFLPKYFVEHLYRIKKT
jgi:glycosyltransferase involved in cell wall biosynthesis